MQFPEFFGQLPRLPVQDPQTDCLGAADGGLLE